MAKKRDREEQKAKKVSAKRRIQEHSSFDRTSIKIPEGVSIFNPKKAGAYRLEIIPYKAGKGNPFADEGELHYERTFYVHRGIGPNSDSYVCPAKTAKKPCPVCEHRAALARDPDADEQLVKDLAPKERQLWNVYDHGDADKGVQVWEVSFHNFGKYLDKKIQLAADDEREEYEGFADPEDGMTVRVGASEESYGKGKYLEFADIEFKPRKEKLDPELFEKASCLDDMIILLGYDELKKIFLQTGDSKKEDKEEGSKKDKADSKKEKDKKPAAKDDEDDDDSDLDDSDVEEKKDKPDEDEEVEVGDDVSFVYKKKTLKGEVVKINEKKGLVSVKCDDREEPYVVAADDETLMKVLEEDSDLDDDDSDLDDSDVEEKKPADKKKDKGKTESKKKDDDDEDDSDLDDDDDD